LLIAIEIARICSTIDGWFTVSECHALYLDDIAPMHHRTMNRYLQALTMFQMLASRRGIGRTFEYRWLGWPGQPTPTRSASEGTR
jgi:hypothetical protein